MTKKLQIYHANGNVIVWTDPAAKIETDDSSWLYDTRTKYTAQNVDNGIKVYNPAIQKIIASTNPEHQLPLIQQADIQWCIDTGAKEVEVEMVQRCPHQTCNRKECNIECQDIYWDIKVGGNGYIVRHKDAQVVTDDEYVLVQPKEMRHIAKEEYLKEYEENTDTWVVWIRAYQSAYNNLEQLIKAKQ